MKIFWTWIIEPSSVLYHIQLCNDEQFLSHCAVRSKRARRKCATAFVRCGCCYARRLTCVAVSIFTSSVSYLPFPRSALAGHPGIHSSPLWLRQNPSLSASTSSCQVSAYSLRLSRSRFVISAQRSASCSERRFCVDTDTRERSLHLRP